MASEAVTQRYVPDLFLHVLATPKSEETSCCLGIAMPAREIAEEFVFHDRHRGAQSFQCTASNAVDDFPAAIYYAFKQSEVSKDGGVTSVWVGRTFLQAVTQMRAFQRLSALGQLEPKQRTRQVAKMANKRPRQLGRSRLPQKGSLDRRGHHPGRVHPRPETRTAPGHRRASGRQHRPGRHAAIRHWPGHGRLLSLSAAVLESDDSPMTVKGRAAADQPRAR